MILGEMKMSPALRTGKPCVPYEGQDLGEQLSDAIQNIHAEITELRWYELEEENGRSVRTGRPHRPQFQLCALGRKALLP
jgi:hypothetical protein